MTPSTTLLTSKQAGKKLGVSHDVIDRLVNAGKLAFVEVGTPKRRRKRISEAELERYVADNTYEMTDPA